MKTMKPTARTLRGLALWCAAALTALVLTVGTAAAQEIQGKITLNGTPPPEIPVDLTDFPDVRKAYPGQTFTTRHYVVGADGGLANVFVYVKEGLEGKSFPLPDAVPLLDQTNAGFYPYVFGVMTNQTFRIRNSEPYMDTVVAQPRVNKELNVAQPVTGMVAQHRFPLAEILIRLRCGVHPWEFGYVGVVAHPFFAVTDPNGRYRLPAGLPPGKYLLEAVHPKAGAKQQEVSIGQGETKAADFVFEPKAK